MEIPGRATCVNMLTIGRNRLRSRPPDHRDGDLIGTQEKRWEHGYYVEDFCDPDGNCA